MKLMNSIYFILCLVFITAKLEAQPIGLTPAEALFTAPRAQYMGATNTLKTELQNDVDSQELRQSVAQSPILQSLVSRGQIVQATFLSILGEAAKKTGIEPALLTHTYDAVADILRFLLASQSTQVKLTDREISQIAWEKAKRRFGLTEQVTYDKVRELSTKEVWARECLRYYNRQYALLIDEVSDKHHHEQLSVEKALNIVKEQLEQARRLHLSLITNLFTQPKSKVLVHTKNGIAELDLIEAQFSFSEESPDTRFLEDAQRETLEITNLRKMRGENAQRVRLFDTHDPITNNDLYHTSPDYNTNYAPIRSTQVVTVTTKYGRQYRFSALDFSHLIRYLTQIHALNLPLGLERTLLIEGQMHDTLLADYNRTLTARKFDSVQSLVALLSQESKNWQPTKHITLFERTQFFGERALHQRVSAFLLWSQLGAQPAYWKNRDTHAQLNSKPDFSWSVTSHATTKDTLPNKQWSEAPLTPEQQSHRRNKNISIVGGIVFGMLTSLINTVGDKLPSINLNFVPNFLESPSGQSDSGRRRLNPDNLLSLSETEGNWDLRSDSGNNIPFFTVRSQQGMTPVDVKYVRLSRQENLSQPSSSVVIISPTLAIRDMNKALQREIAKNKNVDITQGVRLETDIYTPIDPTGFGALLSPEGMSLFSITIEGENGPITSYSVLHNPIIGGYGVQFSPALTDKKFSYQAVYVLNTAKVKMPNNLSTLDNAALDIITNNLTQVGAQELAQKLGTRRGKVSVTELAELISQTGYYTKRPSRTLLQRDKDPTDGYSFTPYRMFLHEGQFFYQCTGSNGLFADIWSNYKLQSPTQDSRHNGEIAEVSGFMGGQFLGSAVKFSSKDAHKYNVAYVIPPQGQNIYDWSRQWILDATPIKQEPPQPAPTIHFKQWAMTGRRLVLEDGSGERIEDKNKNQAATTKLKEERLKRAELLHRLRIQTLRVIDTVNNTAYRSPLASKLPGLEVLFVARTLELIEREELSQEEAARNVFAFINTLDLSSLSGRSLELFEAQFARVQNKPDYLLETLEGLLVQAQTALRDAFKPEREDLKHLVNMDLKKELQALHLAARASLSSQPATAPDCQSVVLGATER